MPLLIPFYADQQITAVPPYGVIEPGEPTLDAGGGTQDIAPDRIESTAQVFAPTMVTLDIKPSAIASTAEVFEPTVGDVGQVIAPARIASTAQVFAPTVALDVKPSTITAGSQVFAPTVALNLKPSAIAATSQVFAPTVAQIIKPDFISPSYAATTVTEPDEITDLVGWYEADQVAGSDGDAVSTWANQSSGTPDFTASSTTRPLIKRAVFGGHDALRFDGSNDALIGGTAAAWKFLHDGTGSTVFVVWEQTGPAEPDEFQSILSSGAFSAAAGTGFNLTYDDRSSVPFNQRIRAFVAKGGTPAVVTYDNLDLSAPNNHAYISAFSLDGTKAGMWTNGTTAGGKRGNHGLTPSSSNPQAALRVGGYYDGSTSFNFEGDIAEIVVYDRFLDDDERAQVTQYLAEKYGIIAPDLEDETTVLDDSADNAFPGLAVCSNGDYLGTFRAATTHSSTDGIIKTVRSTDEGATWGSPVSVLSSGSFDYRDPSLVTLEDGRIVLSWGRRTNAAGEGPTNSGIVISTDDGATWGSLITFTTVFTDWVRGGGPVTELANGDLVNLTYGQDSGDSFDSVELQRSIDGGTTWTSEGVVADGQADSRHYNESVIYQLSDGTLWALMRQGNNAMWKMSSTDDGATWTAPVVAMAGVWSWPKPAVDSDDNVYVLMRNPTSAASASQWLHSPDGGTTWQNGFLLRTPASEHGYAQSVYHDDKILTLYSSEESGSNADLYFVADFTPELGQSQVFAPTVEVSAPDLNIAPSRIESTSQVFAPTLTYDIDPGLVVATSTVYAPTVALNLKPSTIAAASQVFAPTVSQGIRPPAPTSGAQVFAPTLSQTIYGTAPASAAQVFAPRVALVLQPTGIGSTAIVFSPQLDQRISLPLVGPASEVFAPSIAVSIAVPFISPTSQVFTPTLLFTISELVTQNLGVEAAQQVIAVLSAAQIIEVHPAVQDTDVDESLLAEFGGDP